MIQHSTAVHIRLKGTLGTSSTAADVDILRITGTYATSGGIRYYPTNIQDWASLPSTPPDSEFFAWLAPYYQPSIFGGAEDVYLDTSKAYSGINTGATLTATADFGEGNTEKTLPIYWTAFSPPTMICDDDSPVINSGTS